MTAMSPASPSLAQQNVQPGLSNDCTVPPVGSVPGVARRGRTVRPRGGLAHRPIWLTSQCEVNSEARSQIPFAGGGARNPKLLLARYSRRAPRCSPLHPAFVNIRGGAAYVDKPRCVALHCSFGE